MAAAIGVKSFSATEKNGHNAVSFGDLDFAMTFSKQMTAVHAAKTAQQCDKIPQRIQ
jgi:hypothetical protein